MNLLSVLLETQPNPLAPVMTMLGFFIAMVWLYTVQAKKSKKRKEKEEEEKNQMK